jgi:hypothetical protein
MIVELVGASGSGKTTVALAVLSTSGDLRPGRRSLARLSGRQAPAYPTLDSLVFVLPILLRLSKCSSELGKPWRSVHLVKRLKLMALASRSQVHARSRSLFLHDQGLVQALGYLTRDWPNSNKNGLIMQLYEAFGEQALPAMIVAFSADPSLTSTRTKMKGVRHQHLDQIKRTTESLNLHAQILRERFRVPVIELQNNGEIATAADQVKTAIASMPLRDRARCSADERLTPDENKATEQP